MPGATSVRATNVTRFLSVVSFTDFVQKTDHDTYVEL